MTVEEQLNLILDKIDEIQKNQTSLSKTVDHIGETVNTDIKDLSQLTTTVKKLEVEVTALRTHMPEQTREIRQAVETTMDRLIRPIKDVRILLEKIMTKNPKMLYFEFKETFWDKLLRRNKKLIHPDEVEGR